MEGGTLPGVPPPRLRDVWTALSPAQRQALAPHLTGDTPSRWIADVMTRHGYSLGKTTVNLYRRTLRQTGE